MPAMRKLPVVLLCRRRSRLCRRANQMHRSDVLSHRGGVRAIATDVGSGCGGRVGVARRATHMRTANRVVLISRRWDQVGGSIRQRRWLESPDTGEHDHKPSTHRAGNVGLFGVPVVTMLVCFTIPHARLRVHWASGIPCALCYRGWIVHQLGRHPRRESEDSRRAPSLRAKRSNLFFLCAAR
jgi:hypothetical protein